MLINSQYSHIYTQKLPLHNILAEEILIGALLSRKFLTREVSQSLNRYFFSLKRYQILYEYIIDNHKKNGFLNLIEVINKLWGTKLLIDIGGMEMISSNIQKSQSFSLSHDQYYHLKYYINILHYYYIKRLFIQYSNSLIQISYFYHLSLNQLYKYSIGYLNKISNIKNLHSTEYINTNIKVFLKNINNPSKYNGNILSGFRDLDILTNGFKNGDLIILAGRPSMGKTSLAINILNYLSLQLHMEVYMFSLEMSKDEILNKLISLISQINLNQIKNRVIRKQEWNIIQQACQKLMSSSLIIDDNGNSSINSIKSRCKNYIINRSIIIIDYLQLIKNEDKSLENRSQELGNITRELKLLVHRLKSTAIVLSQLNRNIENRANKRPLLSDLRESGCIEILNIPKIQNHENFTTVNIINCFKQYYILTRINEFILYETLKQHMFAIVNTEQKLLCTTHNHKILIHKIWKKEDQIKYNQFNNIKHNHPLVFKLSIEINKLILIKRLNKERSYDLALQEYHNFTIENHIVHNSIEQDADLILMLYKDNANIDNRIIDIVIAKHRHGPIGSFQLLFHADICKFSNIQDQNISKQLLI